MPVGVLGDGRPERRIALSGPPECLGAVGVAEPYTAAPGHGQRLLVCRNRLALLLRDQRHDAHRQVVRLGQVDRGEANPAVPQSLTQKSL